ncbi:MAG: TRAP transporter small permease subunit [Desulfobacteraceae bacterium]|nr:TRAP transporter small permease subunit [Desulfobacteraceae bacterium]
MTENVQGLSEKLCDAAENFIKLIGHIVMWSNGLLILVIILQVVLRYGFGHGMVTLEELQWHLYALGIMMGASYALVTDSHIRVDIIQANMSQKWKDRWELFGIFFLLLPFALVIFHQSLDFVYESFRVNESSDAPLGLPFRWIIKGVIPVSFALLILATIARAIRIFNSMRKGISDGNR